MNHFMILKDTKEHHAFFTDIQNHLPDSFHYEYSTSIEQSKAFIASLEAPTRIYIAGGDGTLNNLLPVLVNTEHEVVMLPLGTGNDLSRLISINKNPVDIFKHSLHLDSHLIDCASINDQYFVNSACFGIDSIIANNVHNGTQVGPKKFQYIISIFKQIFKYNGTIIQMKIDGQEIYYGNSILCTINNGVYYGGGFPITPKAKLDDHLLDICIVDHISLLKVPYLLTFLLRKKLEVRKEAHLYLGKEIEVNTKASSNIDGEEYPSDSYKIKLMPDSIRLVYQK